VTYFGWAVGKVSGKSSKSCWQPTNLCVCKILQRSLAF